MRVLILDDDTVLLNSMQRLLTAWGCVTATATDPQIACTMIDTFHPGAMLLDWHLGSVNAMTLLNELASYNDTLRLPKIVLSSSGRKLKLSDLKAYGVVAVLDKATYQPTELRQLLEASYV